MRKPRAAKQRALEVIEFVSEAFESRWSEEIICCVRGSTSDFESAVDFCIETFRVLGIDLNPYANSSPCIQLDKATFAGVIAAYSARLRASLPTFLLQLDDFVTGVQIADDWDDVGVVGELADSFVAFYWDTTA